MTSFPATASVGLVVSIVVERVLDAYAAGVDPAGRCLAGGDEDRRPAVACRNCGVRPGGHANPV
ncbi:hypothetical protein ACIBD9_21495 [Micromonospora sp. NPDC050784]|uniref:hypothetical protein n=1 Tax=Micromonospora sp. NPDC050784 TaxID=3364281 RepID=UPI00379A1CE8